MLSRILLGALLASGPAIAAAAAVEPIVTTSWDVRRDAEELLADLKAKSGDITVLLERTQVMIAEHGDRLISHGGAFAPLGEVLAGELARQGLDQEFQRIYSVIAARRLDELRAMRGDEAAWRRLAQSYPGTPASQQAWRHLADRNWETGRLGSYLFYARRAGEATDERLRERVAAGMRLLSPGEPTVLPPSLDLEQMWRIDLADNEPPPVRAGRERALLNRRSFALSASRTDLTAASDGRKFFLFDHLVGRIQGRVHDLGDTPLMPWQCVPAVGNDCFVALGLIQPQSGQLVAIDRLGDERWRQTIPTLGVFPSLSAPLIVDQLVVFAALMFDSDEGPELHLHAYQLSDGKPAWSLLVAKLPVLLHRAFMGDDTMRSGIAPAICLHGGSILVLANTGLLARVSADGTVEDIWNYASDANEVNDAFGRRRDHGRGGAVRSDGYTAVATPADASGLVLILGPGDRSPRQYSGDGSQGEVLDVAKGLALLGGGQVSCLDLALGRLRWTAALPLADPSGVIGDGRALVAGRERMALLDLADGRVIDDKGADPPITFAGAEGMVLLGGRDSIVAWGRAQAFLEQQLAAAERDPRDHRPLIALSSLYQAQGNIERAYGYMLQALERGAPPEYAEKAARLVGLRLELVVDDPKAFAGAIAQLQKLAEYNAGLVAEVSLWQGRHAELVHDQAAAATHYRAVLAKPPSRITVANRLEIQLQALAQAGLARLGQAPPPGWMGAPPAAAPLPQAAGAWTSRGLRNHQVLMAGDLVLGYVDGVLAAHRLADGGEAWWRRPDRPLLGVKMVSAPLGGGPGIALDVLDGTSAASAGLQTGDVLHQFNDREIRSFPQDLIPAVLDTGIRGRFTAKVQRNGQPLVVEGVLGGELVEPFAANARTALIWPVILTTDRDGRQEGMWFDAFDLATGKPLFAREQRPTLPPMTDTGTVAAPLLTSGDLVVCPDGNDLHALALREPGGPRERWRLRGHANQLAGARLLNDQVLLLNDASSESARLVDVENGTVLFSFPAEPESGAVLHQGECFALLPGGRLACWDLGLGRQRWRSEKPVSEVVAVSGDAVFVLSDRKQLVILDRFSGKPRRLFGDWNAVDEWRVEDGRIYAQVKRVDLGLSLVSIGLPGGALLWERVLPRGVEVRQVAASSEGLAVSLSLPGQRRSLLDLALDGQVRNAANLLEGEHLQPLRGGMLAIGARGMRLLPPAQPPRPQPVPCGVAAPQASLAATATAALPTLAWQPLGTAAYALARSDRSLLVFARLPPEVNALELRIGDTGPLIDPLNQALIFQRNERTVFSDAAGGWQISGAQKLETEDGTWLCVASLQPPAQRPAGVPVQIRVVTAGGAVADAAAEAANGDTAPWWLRAAWRPVTGAP